MNTFETDTGCRISVFAPTEDHTLVRFTMVDPQDGRMAEVLLTENERLQFIQALVR